MLLASWRQVLGEILHVIRYEWPSSPHLFYDAFMLHMLIYQQGQARACLFWHVLSGMYLV